jgi:hypothetical protein
MERMRSRATGSTRAAYLGMIVSSCTVALLSTVPAFATTDFRDVPILFGKVSEVLETEPSNSPVEWSNPETGNHGTIVVTRTYFLSDGSPCREYTRTTVERDRPLITESGTGCRDSKGAWTLHEGGKSGGKPESILPSTTSGAGSEVVVSPLPPPPAPTSVTPPPAPPPKMETRAEPTPEPTAAPPAKPKVEAEPPAKSKTVPIIASTTMPTRSD